MSNLDLSRHRQLTYLSFELRRKSPDMFLADLPSFLSRLSVDRLQEVQFHTDADEEVGMGWDSIDWPRMDGALASLHKRCPSLIVTFHFSSLRPGDYHLPDVIIGSLTQRLPEALGAGMRIASIISSVLKQLPDSLEALRASERKFSMPPDEKHWLAVAAQPTLL